ncbi:hypothetical protein GE061_014074 [Apolygus lucorum]|uniref:Uncharacterized protein n=1 Tax=Apolygus lucorum TaxID=248454 RepID=A0A8S9XRP1_APOLU|nr:hypothetical protein GE061_014074 [Apolygus lucorum]
MECQKTSDFYRTGSLPNRFECPQVFQHYGCQQPPRHPQYRTTSMAYGFSPPTIHTVPSAYYPKLNTFTKSRGSGAIKSCSLNI